MEHLLFPLLTTIAGIIFLVRNITHLKNEEKMLAYLETNPKAKIWVKKFGIEKTASLTKTVFLPLGCVVSLGFIIFGVFGLYSAL